mmetsp:Transcript_29274/g.42985  ORF Transcript_29274/g.42985 Transcript_29274/m.42985 type:complete len:227 (-) Transcript_29274:113-793(-)
MLSSLISNLRATNHPPMPKLPQVDGGSKALISLIDEEAASDRSMRVRSANIFRPVTSNNWARLMNVCIACKQYCLQLPPLLLEFADGDALKFPSLGVIVVPTGEIRECAGDVALKQPTNRRRRSAECTINLAFADTNERFRTTTSNDSTIFVSYSFSTVMSLMIAGLSSSSPSNKKFDDAANKRARQTQIHCFKLSSANSKFQHLFIFVKSSSIEFERLDFRDCSM